jgi:hypothetical protein
MNIKYYTKNVYGRDVMYLAEPKMAEALTKLTKLKTMSKEHMVALTELGFTFEEVQPTI